MTQKHKDFKCFITDDISTDGSAEIAEEFIKSDDRFILIRNKTKHFQGGNYDQVLNGDYGLKDDEIAIEVDGDDWLPDSNVFSRINEVYSDPNTWIAYGQFRYHDGRPGFASPPPTFSNLRNSIFTASHIRTWRVGLWRKILKSDLLNENGEYYKVSGDLSFMYPMMEMAGTERFKFMSEINYIYNEETPMNDHKLHMPLVTETCRILRNKQSYSKLV
jgi:glycosyltransferase involved in cell wall biosynthesis